MLLCLAHSNLFSSLCLAVKLVKLYACMEARRDPQTAIDISL